jgi:hypothetical protein
VPNTTLNAWKLHDAHFVCALRSRFPHEWNVPQEINLLLMTSKSAITTLHDFTAAERVFSAPGDQLIMEVKQPCHFTYKFLILGESKLSCTEILFSFMTLQVYL